MQTCRRRPIRCADKLTTGTRPGRNVRVTQNTHAFYTHCGFHSRESDFLRLHDANCASRFLYTPSPPCMLPTIERRACVTFPLSAPIVWREQRRAHGRPQPRHDVAVLATRLEKAPAGRIRERNGLKMPEEKVGSARKLFALFQEPYQGCAIRPVR